MKKVYWNGRIIVRLATEEDGLQIADRLRKADQKEIWSAFRQTARDGCWGSVKKSELAYTIELDGVPVAIFGVHTLSLADRRGVIWLLGTDDIERIAITFKKYTKPFIDLFLNEWDSLENWVHRENKISLRWLKQAGFTIEDPVPYGLDEELFRKIFKRKE